MSSDGTIHIHVDSIETEKDFNARHTFSGIQRLAQSIKLNGQLQNIVIRHPQAFEKHDKFYLVAGERRLLAVRHLVSENESDGMIRCIIQDSDISSNDKIFAMLSENEARQEIPIWRVGYRYVELIDSGMTQLDIAARIGKTQHYVGAAAQIAKGLHPDIVIRLDKVSNTISRTELVRMSRLLDENFEPDLKKQTQLLDRLLNNKRKKKSAPRDNIPEKERVIARYRKLKAGLEVPAHALPYLNAFMRYLDGRDFRLVVPEE